MRTLGKRIEQFPDPRPVNEVLDETEEQIREVMLGRRGEYKTQLQRYKLKYGEDYHPEVR